MITDTTNGAATNAATTAPRSTNASGAAAMAADTGSSPRQAMQLAISRRSEPRYIEGRRTFFQYRDLGVTDATHGRARAQVTSARAGMTQATGWHWHVCDMQFVYILRGWVDLEFEECGLVRLGPGDSVLIPGGLPHQEVQTSDDLELLEYSIPADMGTRACEAPAAR